MSILTSDLDYVFNGLEEKEKLKFKDSTVLITGCSGFLGYYFMNFLTSKGDELGIKSIVGLDNFMLGEVSWIQELKNKSDKVKVYKFDVIKDNITLIKEASEADFIIHMASIASPTFYRQYPIETLDANVTGLRKLFDFYKDKKIKGFLFFSSSEIYGDPEEKYIPTDEDYRGNVSCIGPRACYDEAKRFGETTCFLFSEKHRMPITIVRPFNNYGPGMKLSDKRVPADFAKAVFENKDIVIFSDGKPKRTYCYVADAIVGYLKALTYGKFDYFNIGMDKPEISVEELAQIYKNVGRRVFKYDKDILFKIAEDKHYLTHNPSRRCPKIDKARELLNFNPKIGVEDGIERYLIFLMDRKKNYKS